MSKDFTELKDSAYTQGVNEAPADYRVASEDKGNMARYLFGGFTRCLYPAHQRQAKSACQLTI